MRYSAERRGNLRRRETYGRCSWYRPKSGFPFPPNAKTLPLHQVGHTGRESEVMQTQLIKVGRQVVNLAAVTDAKWDGNKLYLHLGGNAFQSFSGRSAEVIWDLLIRQAIDLDTGEVPQSM